MSFNASHFCGFLSYQRAGKLVSGKRKPWGSNEIKSSDWSALCWGGRCCSVQGSGHGSTKGCSALGAQFASVLWVIVTRDNLTQILLPLHAVNFTSEIAATCWWTEDTPRGLECTQCLNVEERKWLQCHSRVSAQTGTLLKASITQKRWCRLELFLNNRCIFSF